jgi:hypothetical protein
MKSAHEIVDLKFLNNQQAHKLKLLKSLRAKAKNEKSSTASRKNVVVKKRNIG